MNLYKAFLLSGIFLINACHPTINSAESQTPSEKISFFAKERHNINFNRKKCTTLNKKVQYLCQKTEKSPCYIENMESLMYATSLIRQIPVVSDQRYEIFSRFFKKNSISKDDLTYYTKVATDDVQCQWAQRKLWHGLWSFYEETPGVYFILAPLWRSYLEKFKNPPINTISMMSLYSSLKNYFEALKKNDRSTELSSTKKHAQSMIRLIRQDYEELIPQSFKDLKDQRNIDRIFQVLKREYHLIHLNHKALLPFIQSIEKAMEEIEIKKAMDQKTSSGMES